MTAAAILPALVVALLVMAAIMTAAWLVQRRSGNPGWIDVFWTFGTGAVLVGVALVPSAPASSFRPWLIAALAAIWSLRLGLYLARRVARPPEDARYTGLRKEWGDRFQPRLLRFALVQALATIPLALAALIAAHSGPAQLGWRDLTGALLLAIAIAGEAIADEQMRRYKQRDQRPPVMADGLWGRSRHPNYFFEWLGWLAYPLIAFDPRNPWTWATLLAPLMIYAILRYGTGVPATEASMLRSRGQPFRDYQARVNAFFPSLFVRSV